MKKEVDVIIIGAGVIGSFVARHMMKKNLQVIVLEKEEDICCGISKAHTAIVHCGYNGKLGAEKGKITTRANENFHNVCEELDTEFIRCGSLVTAKGKDGIDKIKDKIKVGKSNGVKGLHFLNREETLKIEPNIGDEIIASGYAETTGIADPFLYCVGAMENAVDNGAEVYLNTYVRDIEKVNDKFLVGTNNIEFTSKHLINCAGLYSDEINNLIEEPFFEIKPRKGEYIVLDKDKEKKVSHVVFQANEKDDMKGIIIVPTIHGNILLGPSAEDVDDKSDTRTTIESLELIKKSCKRSLKNLNTDEVIATFSGSRPRPNWIELNEQGEYEESEDKVKNFIIERGRKNKHFINVAGIKSPGFTCADEIGKMVSEMVFSDYDELKDNIDFNSKIRKRINVDKLSSSEKEKVIKENPDYGEVICKCNKITKGEIIDSIRRNVGSKDVDGVKRRTSALMGKCQGSRCIEKIEKILNEECSNYE